MVSSAPGRVRPHGRRPWTSPDRGRAGSARRGRRQNGGGPRSAPWSELISRDRARPSSCSCRGPFRSPAPTPVPSDLGRPPDLGPSAWRRAAARACSSSSSSAASMVGRGARTPPASTPPPTATLTPSNMCSALPPTTDTTHEPRPSLCTDAGRPAPGTKRRGRARTRQARRPPARDRQTRRRPGHGQRERQPTPAPRAHAPRAPRPAATPPSRATC